MKEFFVSNLIFLSLKSRHKGLISYHPTAANNACPIPREAVSASPPRHAGPSVNASEAPCRVTAALGPEELCAACDCRESVSCPSAFHLNGKWKMPTSVTSAKLAEAVKVASRPASRDQSSGVCHVLIGARRWLWCEAGAPSLRAAHVSPALSHLSDGLITFCNSGSKAALARFIEKLFSSSLKLLIRPKHFPTLSALSFLCPQCRHGPSSLSPSWPSSWWWRAASASAKSGYSRRKTKRRAKTRAKMPST